MIRRLVFTYLAIMAFGLALLAIPLGITFAHREKDRLLFDVERDADTMALVIAQPVAAGKPFSSKDITRYASNTGGRVVVVDAEGTVLLDTDQASARGSDYSTRPEIALAL